MRRWIFGAVLALAVFGGVTVTSYAVLNHFYGEIRGASASAPLAPEPSKITPAEAYGDAQTTNGTANVFDTTKETRPTNVLPIATTIGIAMGIAAIAVWAGYRQTWGSATSTLLEHGLHNMTVRDVEIVGHIMELKEFTIPELMKMTKASKITVWRTVQKLVEKGLVQQTEKTKLTANGIGGRGKPSNIYRYVEAK